MSNPRYDWWPYVKGMIRCYPALVRERNEKGRLSAINERELQAVANAIADTEQMVSGEARMKVISFTAWEGITAPNLDKAATAAWVSVGTAKRYNREFIYLVAYYFGFLEEPAPGPNVRRKHRLRVGV